MTEIEELKKEITLIKERNKRVEKDKVWETSWTRRFLLIVFTYLAIGLYLQAININNAWLNAIVPAVGFLLSTLTLPFFKKLWIRYILKEKR
jgi:polyferredoxin